MNKKVIIGGLVAVVVLLVLFSARGNNSAQSANLWDSVKGVFTASSTSKPSGGKSHKTTSVASINLSPSSLSLAVGGSDWMHVTLYDKNGNEIPYDGSLLWYGCKPVDTSLGDTCIGYLNVAPNYPNLVDVNVSATGAGVFTVWVDDGNGHRSYSTVTVQ